MKEAAKEKSAVGASNLRADDGKTKFTFTSDGKLLLINEKEAQSSTNALKLDELKISKIHKVKVVKRGVEETKERVLVDKARQTQNFFKKKDKNELDLADPMANVNELMCPGDGVTMQDSKN